MRGFDRDKGFSKEATLQHCFSQPVVCVQIYLGLPPHVSIVLNIVSRTHRVSFPLFMWPQAPQTCLPIAFQVHHRRKNVYLEGKCILHHQKIHSTVTRQLQSRPASSLTKGSTAVSYGDTDIQKTMYAEVPNSSLTLSFFLISKRLPLPHFTGSPHSVYYCHLKIPPPPHRLFLSLSGLLYPGLVLNWSLGSTTHSSSSLSRFQVYFVECSGYTAKDALNFLILLPYFPSVRTKGSSIIPPYGVLGIEPRALHMLSKNSTN